MAQPMTRTARLLTWALALALGLVPSATCLLAAEIGAAQKTSCGAMSHDEGDTAVKQDCCATDSSNLPSPASGQLIAPLAPPSIVPESAVDSQLRPAGLFLRSTSFTDGSHSTRPTYLFDSVFRL